MSVVSPSHPGIKARFLKPVACATCGTEHRLGTKDGWLCQINILDDGSEEYQRLEDRAVTFVQATRSYRCYVTVTLPCGGTHRERLDRTEQDKRTTFNRAEHLRQHPKGSPVYAKTYGWRADAESDNNNLDSHMYRHRMIVDHADDQLLVMMGHALARNAMSAAVSAARQLSPPALAA